MMKIKRYHIIINHDQFSVVGQGRVRAYRNFKSENKAMNCAQRIKQATQVIVHDKNGDVRRILDKQVNGSWKNKIKNKVVPGGWRTFANPLF